jgi:Nitrile hydratase, alpha chain
MSDQSSSNRNTVTSQVIERATRDSQFRQELLRDPNGTLERELGVNIAAGVEIRVVEETPSTLYLVLPPQPMQAGQEFSDQELERVAGGLGSGDTCLCPPATFHALCL